MREIYLGSIPHICRLSDLKLGLRSHLRPDAAQRGQIREILVVLVLTRAGLIYRKNPWKSWNSNWVNWEIHGFFVNILNFHTFSWFSGIFIGRWFLDINIWNFPIAMWNFPEGTSGGSWRLPGWTARNHDEGPLAFSQQYAAVLMAFNNDKPHMMQSLSGWWLSHNSEKYEFVSWDDSSQYMEKLKNVQTTNQLLYSVQKSVR